MFNNVSLLVTFINFSPVTDISMDRKMAMGQDAGG